MSNIIFFRFISCTWSQTRAQWRGGGKCLNCNKKGELVDEESEETFEKALEDEHNDDVRFVYDL